MDKYAQYSKPNFTLRLRDILIVEGSAARLDCKISGVPDPDIRWFKDHKEIEDGQHYSIEYEDDETCTLIIQEAFLVDAGTYTCQASNLLGRISCDAIVRVEREYCLSLTVHLLGLQLQIIEKKCSLAIVKDLHKNLCCL